MANLSDEQKKAIDERIKRDGLNEFGDPKGTNYMGGTPLFDEMTGETKDRYEHIVGKHPGWLPRNNDK